MLRKSARLLLCFSISFTAALLSACGAPDDGTLFYGTLGRGEPIIIAASSKTAGNLGTNAIVTYDIGGVFREQLADLTAPDQKPRGLALLSPFNFIVSLEGATKILAKTSFFGGYSTFASGTTFTMPMGPVARYTGNGNVTFNIQGNTIDAFGDTGARIAATSSPVIATITGSCVLSSPKGLFVDSVNHRLFVTNSGTNGLLVYNVSTPTAPTCERVNATLPGSETPMGVLKHSNGYLYVTSSVFPSVSVKLYGFAADGSGTATAVYTDVSGTVLNLSTAIAELPDGTVIVANSGTGQIDRFQVDALNAATRVGSSAYIKDSFTTLVTDLLVLPGL